MKFKLGDRVFSRFNGNRYKVVVGADDGELFLEVVGYRGQPDLTALKVFPRAWVRYNAEYDEFLEACS